MTDQMACLIAAFTSVLPLAVGLQPGEQNLLKLLFFPLAFRCLCDKLMETGLVPKFKHGDILFYMLCGVFCSYTYMIEHSSCPGGMYRMVDNYAKLDLTESRTWRLASTKTRADLATKYNLGY